MPLAPKSNNENCHHLSTHHENLSSTSSKLVFLIPKKVLVA